MRSLYEAATWLFGSLACALLVIGSMAVPAQMAFADTGDCQTQCDSQCAALYQVGTPEYNDCVNSCMEQCMLAGVCPSSSVCSNGCANSQPCFVAGCTGVSGCTCSAPADPRCAQNCKCKTAGSACDCGPK